VPSNVKQATWRTIWKGDKIPLLTGIGGFRLSDKISTQTDNATGRGNWRQTEKSWWRQGALGNRGQRPERVIVMSSTVGAFHLTDKMGIFWAVNIINKQRKEWDRSIPGSLLLGPLKTSGVRFGQPCDTGTPARSQHRWLSIPGLLKLLCSIAPFSHSTRRFRPASLIKQTQGSKFTEFYLKKLLNSWTNQLKTEPSNIVFRR